MILMIEAAHFFINDPTKSTVFYALTAYMSANRLLKDRMVL